MSDMAQAIAEFFRDEDGRKDYGEPWGDDYRLAKEFLDKFDVSPKEETAYEYSVCVRPGVHTVANENKEAMQKNAAEYLSFAPGAYLARRKKAGPWEKVEEA